MLSDDELGEVLWVGCDDDDFVHVDFQGKSLCGDQNIDVIDTANICKQICDLERMIYVRFLVVAFAMVAGMTNSGKARRLKEFI